MQHLDSTVTVVIVVDAGGCGLMAAQRVSGPVEIGSGRIPRRVD